MQTSNQYDYSPSCRPTGLGEVKINPTYQNDERARLFWRTSFRVGRNYLTSNDASGLPVLIQHEREEAESYARRLRATKSRNFVGPIIRRYNDLVFRKAPVRDIEMDEWKTLWGDVTGTGMAADEFFKEALLLAQIDRECYIVPDVLSPNEIPTGQVATVAQLDASEIRPVLVRMSASVVIDWRERAGQLTEVLAIWALDDGRAILRWWGETDRQDFILSEQYLTMSGGGYPTLDIVEIGAPIPHGYDRMPVSRLRPNLDPLGPIKLSDGDSQAGPLSESQQSLNNLLSLRVEEIVNVTFSQYVAAGVAENQVKDLKVGNNRIICLPNPAATLKTIGADPAQARSIAELMDDETANLMRTAGINPAGAESVQSGVALAFRHNDLATITAALANSVEACEAQLAVTIAGGWQWDLPARTIYQGKDADLPDMAAETASLLQVISNQSVPQTIRNKFIDRYVSRNLSLSDEERTALDAEMKEPADGGIPARVDNPFAMRGG